MGSFLEAEKYFIFNPSIHIHLKRNAYDVPGEHTKVGLASTDVHWSVGGWLIGDRRSESKIDGNRSAF